MFVRHRMLIAHVLVFHPVSKLDLHLYVDYIFACEKGSTQTSIGMKLKFETISFNKSAVRIVGAKETNLTRMTRKRK